MKTCLAALTVSIILLGLVPPTALAGDIDGKASMGMALGVAKYQSGDDWSDGSMRFSGQVMFQYGISNSLALQIEAGGLWNNNGGQNLSDIDSLRVESDTLSVVFPVTIGFQYRAQLGESNFWPHIGAGVGIYNMGIKDSYRHWANDAVTDESLLWSGWGGYGKIGTDYFFGESVSMNFDLTMHVIYADEGDRFTDRFTNENVTFVQFRAGVNYFFQLGEEDGTDDHELENNSENEGH